MELKGILNQVGCFFFPPTLKVSFHHELHQGGLCCTTEAFLAFADELEIQILVSEAAEKGWTGAKPMPTSDVCSQPQSL